MGWLKDVANVAGKALEWTSGVGEVNYALKYAAKHDPALLSMLPFGKDYLNYNQQQQNLEMQKQAYAQQQNQYQIQNWQNQNAMQIRSADLVKAGLSPVLAAGGGGASSTSPISSQAPQGSMLTGNSGLDTAHLIMSMLTMSKDFAKKDEEINNLKVQYDDIAASAWEKTEKARLAKHDADFYQNKPFPSNATNQMKNAGAVYDALPDYIKKPTSPKRNDDPGVRRPYDKRSDEERARRRKELNDQLGL